MIRTLQGAWWETLFGTLPSRKRLAPVMPLLPTTIRSDPFSSATSRIASAGSPCRANVSVSTPGLAGDLGRRAERRLDVLARVDHPLQVLRRLLGLLAQPRVGHGLVGADDLQLGAERPASAMAWRTASPAVSEPSVPTTIEPNIGLPCEVRRTGAADYMSLTIATTMPIRTKTTMAVCIQIHVGDIVRV